MKAPKVVILVDTATGWGRRVVRGVLDYAMQHGPWDVWIEPKGQDEVFRIPDEETIDGIIARVSSGTIARELEMRNIPTVNVSGLVLKGYDFPQVTVDWQAAATLAEQHFRDRALRNFAYVGPLHLAHVRDHERAFEKTLAESNTPCHVFMPRREIDRSIPWSIRSAELIPWLESLPKPIGIYTWGFQIGRDVISACQIADIPIPHDVAVLGGDYDDLLSDASHPSLSGIISPATKVGFQAASILYDMMKGDKPPTQPIFLRPEEIEERLSTEILAIEDPQVLQAVTYLREHACEDIHVDDILKKVPMARRALERRFVQHLGRSPAQEIRRVRIDHARRLLAQTNLSMQEIAEACGYSTYNYLGNVFKKETGISPGRYRTSSRET